MTEQGASLPVSAPSLAVRTVRLSEFRSYPSLDIDLESSPVVLIGPNGAGKTNLLEAISLLGPGRGLRRARPADLCREGRASWSVFARIQTGAGTPVEIGTGLDAARRRIVKVDGKAARSQADLARLMALSWLTPDMDGLLAESTSARRRFLDRLVFGLDPDHAQRVQHYEQNMRERLRLLIHGTADTVWLDALEDQMAASAVAIHSARSRTATALDEACAQTGPSFPIARLTMQGSAHAMPEDASTLATIWRESRPMDAQAGMTLRGPHKVDLAVRFAEKNRLAQDGSTGEQKALLVAVLLAHARLVRQYSGRTPLLVLDEVAAHLDDARRQAMGQEILSLGAQAWLSGTDAADFSTMRDHAQFLSVLPGDGSQVAWG